jgi:hypothetical protein
MLTRLPVSSAVFCHIFLGCVRALLWCVLAFVGCRDLHCSCYIVAYFCFLRCALARQKRPAHQLLATLLYSHTDMGNAY